MTETTAVRPAAAPVSDAELRAVERYLFQDADLLDEWRLHEWLARFALDCHYLVPSPDLPEGDPSRHLFLVQDDRFLLEQRVNSLLTRAAHAEYPHSRTRRLITNIQAVDEGDDRLTVHANFAIYRSRPGVFDTYVGRYRHVLRRDAEHGYVFLERRAVLDLDTLRPQGKVSIIL